MTEIKFSREEKEVLSRKIQNYLDEELEFNIGVFDAEFLLEFFSKEIGTYFYNKGFGRS